MAIAFHEFEGKEYISKEDHELVMRDKIKELTDKRKETEKLADERESQLKDLQKQLEQKAEVEGKLTKYQNKLALTKLGLSADSPEEESDLEEVLKIALTKFNSGKKEAVSIEDFVSEIKSNPDSVPFILKAYMKKEEAIAAPAAVDAAPRVAPSKALASQTLRVPDSQPLSSKDQLLEEAKAGKRSFAEAYALSKGQPLPDKKEEK